MKKNKKETKSLSMPWEKDYGYAQAVRPGRTVWIAGQLAHDAKGNLLEGMGQTIEVKIVARKSL